MNKTLLFLSFIFFSTEIVAQQVAEKISIVAQVPSQMKKNQSIELKVSIKNTLLKEGTGNITLELFDTKKNTSVDGWFYNIYPFQYFTGTPGDIFFTNFPFTIPGNFIGKIRIAITAKCGNTKDSVSRYILIK